MSPPYYSESVMARGSSSGVISGYQSDDDLMARRSRMAAAQRTGIYSREDFREQYCINQRALEGFDKSKSTSFLFGCISSYQESPCKKRDNFFTSCYGRHPSDENVHAHSSAPISPQSRDSSSAAAAASLHYPRRWREGFMETSDDGGFEGQQGRRRPRSVAVSRENLYNEAKRYTWNEQMERYVERGGVEDWTRRPAGRYPSAPVTQIESTRKHVSFDCSSLARSATASSFDEHKIRKARFDVFNSITTSQERLLDGRKTPELPVFVDVKAKIPKMRTQATQTETFIVRASGPPPYLSLSPRTSYRSRDWQVRMVSQGAQTNGMLNNEPKAKSTSYMDKESSESDHEARKRLRAPLQKTLSDGEILLERKKTVNSSYSDTTRSEETIVQNRFVDLEDNQQMQMSEEEEEEDNQDIKDNEDFFHENILQLIRSSTAGVEEKKDDHKLHLGESMDSGGSRETGETKQTTSPTESSSSGSYSVFEFNESKERLRGRLKLEFPPGVNMYSLPRSPAISSFHELEGKNLLVPPCSPESRKSSVASDNVFEKLPIFDLPLPETINNNGQLLDLLVKPPEGWGDSPDTPTPKMTKKVVLKKKSVKGKTLRAKSEERQPIKFADCKQDAATQSSISLHASLHDLSTIDDDDSGIYMEPYTLGIWVYIGENEELQVWKSHEPLARTSSGESTISEKEFNKKFTALTHRMVHRKASGETYRRLASNSLEINKRVTLTRKGGEFGFRIHGSRPVVVSAVEAGTPAEESGLEVGDVIMSINGVAVLDSSHSDVVRIARSDVLEMELARTADILLREFDSSDVFNGYLLKCGQMSWVRRWFSLKSDYCMYYYKNEDVCQGLPLGALSLIHCTINAQQPITNQDNEEIFPFQITRANGPSIVVATFNYELRDKWINVINQTIQQAAQDDKWIALSGRYVMGPPDGILNSDCDGVLAKLGRRLKTWTRRFCVLKDACIYFFSSQEVTTALGAAHLHGYRVQTVTSLGGKKHAFELIPPIANMRHYYLAADTEHDRKRWLAALEYSIDRWINLGKM